MPIPLTPTQRKALDEELRMQPWYMKTVWEHLLANYTHDERRDVLIRDQPLHRKLRLSRLDAPKRFR